MGQWTDQIVTIVGAIASKNGRYDTRTPKMRASDMVAFLGLYSSSLPSMIDRVSDRIVRSDFADASGLFKPLGSGGLYGASTLDAISSSAYLFGATPGGAGDVAWKRAPSKPTQVQLDKAKVAGWGGVPTYEPVRDPSYVRSEQLELLGFMRQAINDYQRASDAIADTLTMYPTDQVASSALCSSFMSGLRALASDLEVMQENPPTTFWQDVRGAFNAAAAASAEATVQVANAAGDAAAKAANLAGQAAAAGLGGFFDAANLPTLIVAGLVGYVALQRFV